MKAIQLGCKVILCLGLAIILQWTVASNVQAQADEIEFNFDSDGLAKGDIVSSITISNVTMSIDAIRNNGSGGTVAASPTIFDTGDPHENDLDLGTPNEDCPNPGPGVSSETPNPAAPGAPGENCIPLGNVLIIQNPDFDEPNDFAGGGTITLSFNIPVQVIHIDLLDVDEDGVPAIEFRNSSGVIDTVSPGFPGDNSFQSFTPPGNPTDVEQIVVRFPGSGAIDTIAVIPVGGVQIIKYINGNDANEPNGDDVPALSPGDNIIWAYHVTNIGSIPYPIGQVNVTDSDITVNPVFNQVLTGDADDTLEPGEVWEYIAEGVALDLNSASSESVKRAHCPNGDSQNQDPGYNNIGTVEVPNASDSDPANYCQKRSLVFRKFVNGFDANTVATAPEVAVGATLTWTYWVTNTGQVGFPLATVVVTDTDPTVTPIFNQAIVGNADDILDPGEVWEFIDTGSMPAPDRPDTNGDKQECGVNPEAPVYGYINGATVTIGELKDNDIAIACPGPSIALRKFVNGFDANTVATAPIVAVGAPLTWTYWVTNTGQVAFPLATVVVTDTDPTVMPIFNQVIVGNADDILDPGEVWEYIDTGTMPAPDRPDTNGDKQDCGSRPGEESNFGYVNGAKVTVGVLSDGDIAIACTQKPSIIASRVDSYQLSYMVTNPPVEDEGLPLENIVVRAAYPGVTITCPKDTMEPGESMVCSAEAPNIAFRNSLGWVTADPVGGGSPIIRVVSPDAGAETP